MKPYYERFFCNKLHELYLKEGDIFTHLLNLNWEEVTEARKEYFMSEVPLSYTYGKGVGIRTYTSSPFTNTVFGIMNILNYETASAYNVCFLNRYDGQKQHLGWHSDDSPTMDKTHPIAVVSFGAEREIWWRPIGFTGVIPKENRQLLEHGSLFVMPSGFQELYQHRIPKSDRECRTRISLTFRKYL